ncbi:AAA family ATPase [Pectobacterium versatile]|uniref:AAA family ATPase n=1 Tax=Pectobacterium versatile TaxID=2488639 RepID=UPI0032F022DB
MLIFIAGAHAVGKSYLCDNFLKNKSVNDIPVKHKSASQLIKEGKEQSWDIDKKTKDVGKNQEILLLQLEKIKNNKENLLLDGHFILLSENGCFNKISYDVFKSMGIDCVVLIETTDGEIRKRFKERGANLEYDPTELMNLEKNSAKDFCEEMGVKFISLMSPSIGEFSDIINAELKKE